MLKFSVIPRYLNYLLQISMASETLKICSYNVNGIDNINWEYLNKIVKAHNFVLLQEH